jgi:hypothetical protein
MNHKEQVRIKSATYRDSMTAILENLAIIRTILSAGRPLVNKCAMLYENRFYGNSPKTQIDLNRSMSSRAPVRNNRHPPSAADSRRSNDRLSRQATRNWILRANPIERGPSIRVKTVENFRLCRLPRTVSADIPQPLLPKS